MKTVIRPPVPELACAKGETVEELALYFVQYHNAPRIPWNYRSGIRTIMGAYKGLHNLEALAAASKSERTKQGRSSNEQIIRAAAPFAFGRSTQVFQLPARRFSYGRDRSAAYRIPFFFVEDGVIKLYFLQPRKTGAPSFDELCMTATIHKKYLIDTEFFGQPVDVEYVDVGPEVEDGPRSPRKYSLRELPLLSEERLVKRLTMISAALDMAEASGLVKAKRRVIRPEPEMPLFD